MRQLQLPVIRDISQTRRLQNAPVPEHGIRNPFAQHSLATLLRLQMVTTQLWMQMKKE